MIFSVDLSDQKLVYYGGVEIGQKETLGVGRYDHSGDFLQTTLHEIKLKHSLLLNRKRAFKSVFCR